MIGGFNTDIVLDGVVFHIQTEDKGAPSREIVTQIFREGAVVFTRRTPYPTGTESPRQDIALQGLLREQHSQLIQFVRAGGLKRKDLLQKALGREPEPQTQDGAEGSPAMPPPTPSQPVAAEELNKTRSFGAPVIAALRRTSPSRAPGKPKTEKPTVARPERPAIEKQAPEPPPPAAAPSAPPATAPSPVPVADAPTRDNAGLDDFLKDLAGPAPGAPPPEAPPPAMPAPEGAPPPAEAAAPRAAAPTPDQAPRPRYDEGEKCEIQLLSSSAIHSGEVQPLRVRIQSDRRQLAVPNAAVEVRIFGKTIRPIHYRGRSNAEGIFAVDILVPHYTVGDGHVEIEATGPLGKRLLRLDVTKSPASK